MFWPEQLFMDTLFSAAVVGVVIFLVLRRRGSQSRRPGRSFQLRLPRASRVVFPVALPDAQAFPGRPRNDRHDRDPDGPRRRDVDLAIPRSHLASQTGPFPGMRSSCSRSSGPRGYLTVQAMRADAADSSFQESRKKADAARQRAIYLAGLPDVGIPPDGSAYILRRDPLTQGRNVLERRCLGCHFFEGKGSGEQTASDLAHFGSRAWVRGLLDDPSSPTYFGKVAKFDGMAEWKKSSKLCRQGTRRRGGFRGVVRRDSRRHDDRRLGQ